MVHLVIPEEAVDAADLWGGQVPRHALRQALEQAAPSILTANQTRMLNEATAMLDNVRGHLDLRDGELVSANEQRDELRRRIDVVLTWHNPAESHYRDINGNVVHTMIECGHCSSLMGDGVTWPCATARALGAGSDDVTL